MVVSSLVLERGGAGVEEEKFVGWRLCLRFEALGGGMRADERNA